MLALVNIFKKEPSPALVLAYAAAEGVFVGGISAWYEYAFGGGIVAQAVVATLVVVGVTLALFAYVAVVLVVSVPWAQALAESLRPWAFLPEGTTGKAYAAMVVAVLGTTISPYLFFWQATQEVEDCLALHPKVLDVAVIGVPDPEMGEKVKAVVQPAEGTEGGPELEQELIGFVQERIARYKAPASVDFTDFLPRTPTGKLVKRELRDRYA